MHGLCTGRSWYQRVGCLSSPASHSFEQVGVGVRGDRDRGVAALGVLWLLDRRTR